MSDADVRSMGIFDELTEVERIGNRAIRRTSHQGCVSSGLEADTQRVNRADGSGLSRSLQSRAAPGPPAGDACRWPRTLTPVVASGALFARGQSEPQ